MTRVKIRWVEQRCAARLAWSVWVACLALGALALLLDFLHTEDILTYPWQTLRNDRLLYPIYAVLTGALSLVYPTIGALIVSRLPRNPIGWIFCGVGLLYQLHHFALACSNYTVAEGDSLLWGEYAAWFSAWVGFAGLILAFVFLVLLFPDGGLPSPRWRIVTLAVVVGTALTVLAVVALGPSSRRGVTWTSRWWPPPSWPSCSNRFGTGSSGASTALCTGIGTTHRR
jgi:hypothetical protein